MSFRMMRQAADNGMRYLVMEVSSQAYKVHRVHGLTFDIGAFLNISPDHISPIEHPTFEDYLHCKRQLITNCKNTRRQRRLRPYAAAAAGRRPRRDSGRRLLRTRPPMTAARRRTRSTATADGSDPNDFRVAHP